MEDRCIKWADHTKKKKMLNEEMLERFSECTFNPTLISKQFKKKVCPNYDFKHKDRVIADELAQEYHYFTHQNDI